jgi:hypothetical protein
MLVKTQGARRGPISSRVTYVSYNMLARHYLNADGARYCSPRGDSDVQVSHSCSPMEQTGRPQTIAGPVTVM